MSRTTINFAFINQYFDSTNYTEPIKKFIDDSLFFTMQKGVAKYANLYVKHNYAELNDGVVTL